MSFLCDNYAAIVVATVASLVAWLFGGARGDWLTPVVPWILLFMLEVIICFPQRHHGESSFYARERVWEEIRHSALFWLTFGFLLLLMIPFANTGLCLRCDADLIAQGISPAPKLPFLPFCINRLEHLNVVMWFAVALLAMIAVHFCLTRRGKRLVIELIVWNGAALAVFGFVQGAMNAPGPFWTDLSGNAAEGTFFATFGYPNMAGDYFTTLFGLSVALWRDRCEHLYQESLQMDPSTRAANEMKSIGRFWRQHYHLMPAVVFFFAALNTFSRAAIVLVTATACVYFFHTLLIVIYRMKKSRRVFVGVWSVLVFMLIVFFASIFMPKSIRREVSTLGTTEVLDRVTGKGEYHVQLATEIWHDHLLFGCGGWGYRHLCVPKMRELGLDPKKLPRVGGANVHNDYLQFLAEHGLVGAALLVAIVGLLIWPILRQWAVMVKVRRFNKTKRDLPKPLQIFALPQPVFFILTASVATLIHAFGDCPLRSCAVLTLFFISIASLPGFMPKQVTSHHH